MAKSIHFVFNYSVDDGNYTGTINSVFGEEEVKDLNAIETYLYATEKMRDELAETYPDSKIQIAVINWQVFDEKSLFAS